MNRVVLIILIAVALTANQISAQFNQQYPVNQQQQFPARFPNQFPTAEDLCRRPGANCRVDNRFAEEQSVTNERGQTQRYQKFCDEGGCYERKYYNGTSTVATNLILMSSTIFFALFARMIMNLF